MLRSPEVSTARGIQRLREQLQRLNEWLDRHRSGLARNGDPASGEPIELQINLRPRDGGTTKIYFLARGGGGHYLYLAGPDTMAYRSFAGIYQSWVAIRMLAEPDIAILHRLVGIP